MSDDRRDRIALGSTSTGSLGVNWNIVCEDRDKENSGVSHEWEPCSCQLRAIDWKGKGFSIASMAWSRSGTLDNSRPISPSQFDEFRPWYISMASLQLDWTNYATTIYSLTSSRLVRLRWNLVRLHGIYKPSFAAWPEYH